MPNLAIRLVSTKQSLPSKTQKDRRKGEEMNLRFEIQKSRVMKRVLFIHIVVFMGFGAHQALRAQTPAAPDEKRATQPRKRGGVFTMYALDPLARTLCFSDGKEGMAFSTTNWGNRCSDLSYSLAGNGSFVSGIEVNRVAAIVDLGTPDQLRERYDLRTRMQAARGSHPYILRATRSWSSRKTFARQNSNCCRKDPNSLLRLDHLPLPRLSWVTFTSCGSQTRKTEISSSS